MKTTTQHLYARPFNGTKQRMTNHFLIFILALVGAQANAITIDFAQIPDGTLASANNPCAGTLNIQAENGHGVLADGLQYSLVWTEASIRNGALEALPTRGANDVGYYYSRVIANFLQPVTDASFSVFTWRPGVYSYIGEDGSGNVFRGSGHTAWDFTQVPGDWLTIDLDLPAGYFLTSFAINNGDPKPDDAAIWIRDIAFTPVPDSANTMPLLLFTCVCLLLAARHTASRSFHY